MGGNALAAGIALRVERFGDVAITEAMESEYY